MSTLPSSTASASSGWAFARYEQVGARLPGARFPASSQMIENLSDLAGEIDLFLLDAFGVLNVGETAIPGAIARIAELRALGAKCYVVTNSASFDRRRSLTKFQKLGYDFSASEILSSREAAMVKMRDYPNQMRWGVATTNADQLDDVELNWHRLEEDSRAYESADGFLFLSSAEWTEDRQRRLEAALFKDNTRPLVIGNPDIVAPREDGLSLEPGSFAHDLADRTGVVPDFYGKPFANIFDLILTQALVKDIPKERIAMVGDSLHTDILGGAAAGIKTVLVTNHGMLKGQDIPPLIKKSGIVPNFIAPTT